MSFYIDPDPFFHSELIFEMKKTQKYFVSNEFKFPIFLLWGKMCNLFSNPLFYLLEKFFLSKSTVHTYSTVFSTQISKSAPLPDLSEVSESAIIYRKCHSSQFPKLVSFLKLDKCQNSNPCMSPQHSDHRAIIMFIEGKAIGRRCCLLFIKCYRHFVTVIMYSWYQRYREVLFHTYCIHKIL